MPPRLIILIDGHNDLPWAMRELCDYDLEAFDISGAVAELHTDLPRLRAGGVTGQFWSVYVPSTLSGPDAVSMTLEQIDFVHRMIRRYPNHLAFARTADEVRSARRNGRIASLIGMEGGHSINQSLAVLRMMHDLGARYMTLTHNDNVTWADSATDEPRLGGLGPFGHEVVREMNSLGMIVDLSHVSADVMRQAMAATSVPVMFSHSSARAVCDVPRNVPDDVLATLRTNGGVCMVTFVADFVSPAVAAWMQHARRLFRERDVDGRPPQTYGEFLRERRAVEPPPHATVNDVVAHLEHVREVAGIEHVGIGGDYDGTAFLPEALEDVSGYTGLFDALTERNWSANDLDRLRADNILRVMHDAEVM